MNIDKSETCLGAAILMGKHVLPEAENYWSSYLCSQSSITDQVTTRQHFKKPTETIHINNNDRDPMLVNGMNKWQFFTYCLLQSLYYLPGNYMKPYVLKQKITLRRKVTGRIYPPTHCMKYVQKHVKDTNPILPLNQHFLNT